MIKQLLVISTLFLLLATTTQAQPPYDQYTVMVEGLGCPFCAYGLEKKFKELKGLKKPVIDMETGKFTFQYPNSRPLSIQRVEEQVAAAGYTAVQVAITRADGQEERSEVASNSTVEEVVSKQLQVAGNCGMCRARIEKQATTVAGVQSASWEASKEQLTIIFDPKQTSLSNIAKAIAQAGHDNALAKAPKTIYEQLPACCLYR